MEGIIILWIIFMLAEKLFKKTPTNSPPSGENNFPDFDIPTLSNDPNFPNEEIKIVVNDKTQPAEILDLTEIYERGKKIAEAKEVKLLPVEDLSEENFVSDLNLTSESAMDAMVLSEIFSKPKALRR